MKKIFLIITLLISMISCTKEPMEPTVSQGHYNFSTIEMKIVDRYGDNCLDIESIVTIYGETQYGYAAHIENIYTNGERIWGEDALFYSMRDTTITINGIETTFCDVSPMEIETPLWVEKQIIDSIESLALTHFY